MAKQTGLGDYIAVDDSGGSARDISDNIVSYEIGNSQNMLDSTTISKSAMERLIGIGDLTVSLSMIFDAASNKSHDVFKTKSGTWSPKKRERTLGKMSPNQKEIMNNY